MAPIRVVQWFTGDIARHQMRLVHDHPALDLVGAVVWHDDKVGLDAGEIAGIGPIGVTATADPDEALALGADVVLYNPPTERYDEIVAILASGTDVISIMGGWNPRRDAAWPDLERACRGGRSSLFGTGLNPGLSYEMALLASSICHEVHSVRISTCERQSTMSPVFLRKFGFGRTEDDLRTSEDGMVAIFENLLQVTDLLCRELDLPHDGTDLSFDYEPSTRDYDDKLEVRKGTMAGLVVTASSTHEEHPVATIEIRFLLGTDYVSEAFLAGAPEVGWIDVDVRGVPGSRFTHEVYAEEKIVMTRSTGTKAVNAVPAVVAAPPGLLSPHDLALPRILHFKYADTKLIAIFF